MSLINANCAAIKNIKGNISKIIDGIFKKVKKIGKVRDTLVSLKKFTSSNIFKIKAKEKKIKNVLIKVVKNIFPKYTW